MIVHYKYVSVRQPLSETESRIWIECMQNAQRDSLAFQTEWVRLGKLIQDFPESMRTDFHLLIEEFKKLYRAAPHGEIGHLYDDSRRLTWALDNERVCADMLERIFFTRDSLLKIAGALKINNQISQM